MMLTREKKKALAWILIGYLIPGVFVGFFSVLPSSWEKRIDSITNTSTFVIPATVAYSADLH